MRAHVAGLLLAAGMALGGCTESKLHMSPDFGVALRQDLAAQIADPDAQYEGTIAPGSSGARVRLAQERYRKGEVIKPMVTTGTAVRPAASGGGAGAGASPGTK